ncbi:M48 family metalloprotease [Ramlibacter sp. XY19]|uniref:M48 family metalloprotease n=1 Tax=Ramlibacter paludis TaxID=2908000 RepID=UPI0023D99F4D|nr:M48 family metalloprotease [Ramlibacter paludis]MCG2591968.1 M48 family metalloprotease [Ramlibacter paludis]
MQLIAVSALLAACGAAGAQDAGKALGGLLRPINPNLLNTLPVPSAASAPAPAASELLKLLGEPDRIDEARELEIGRELAALLVGSKPLHQDVALQRYVNRLGRWISLQGSRPHLPWNFAVLDDAGFNAFAAPGGYVFVTKGLVDRADEAELAGILAHEITHVNRRHHLQALAAGARAGIATQVIASQVRGAAANALSAQLLALGRKVYARGLDQADEFEADREGVALAARAGFDPYGLPSVLQQVRTARADDPLFALTLSTHPPAQQRLEQLEGAMGSRLDAFSGKPSVPIAQRLR